MMERLRQLAARLLAMMRRRRHDADFDDELAGHVAMATEELERDGHPPEQARRLALVRLGGIEPTRDLHRDTRGLPAAERLWLDLRDAARGLRRAPGFTVVAVGILALGIGANTAVFSLVRTLLLEPPPFEDAGRLVWISNQYEGSEQSGLSGRSSRVFAFEGMVERTQTMSELTAYHAFYGYGTYRLTTGREPDRLVGVPVAGNFFSLLGVTPALGRAFTAEETSRNGPDAVMLSHKLWQSRFDGRTDVIGERITLNGVPSTIVGVTPVSFDFSGTFAPGSDADFFLPLRLDDARNQGNTLAIVGRLAPNATLTGAHEEFDDIIARLKQDLPEEGESYGASLVPMAEFVSGSLRTSLSTLWAAVTLILLLIGVNLANLTFARSSGRRREMAVRAALGAGRRRLTRQLLTESLVIALASAAIGLGVAWGLLQAVRTNPYVTLPLLEHVTLDRTAFLVTLGAGLVAGLVAGLLPALHLSATNMSQALRDDARGSTGSLSLRLARSILVTAEVALACVLLVGATLLLRSFIEVMQVDLGFEPDQASVVRVDTRADLDPELRAAFFGDLLTRVRSIPGVTAAGISDTVPMDVNRTWGYRRPDRTVDEVEWQSAYVRRVSDDYFRAMGIRLLRGRDFDSRDQRDNQRTIVINQTMAETLYPNEDPIDRLVLTNGGEHVIIGVAGDVRHARPEDPSGAEMYFGLAQTTPQSADLVIRASVPTTALAGPLRVAIHDVDPTLPVTDLREVETLVDRAVSSRRLLVWLIGGFATLAVVLASLGIYGVVSNGVSQRTQEIGIRMALGATAWRVQAGVLTDTLKMAFVGVIVGFLGAVAAGPAMAALLFGVTVFDPATYLSAAALLVAVALVAAYLPARRASQVSPLTALRS